MNAYQLMRINQDPIDPDKRLRIHKLFEKKARRRVIPQHIYKKLYHPERDRYYRLSSPRSESHRSSINRRFSASPPRSKVNTILQDVDIPVSFTYKRILPNKTNKSNLRISPNHEYMTGHLFDPPIKGKRRISRKTKSDNDVSKQGIQIERKSIRRLNKLHRKDNVGGLLLNNNTQIRPKSALVISKTKANISTPFATIKDVQNTPLVSQQGKRMFRRDTFIGTDIFGIDSQPPPKAARASFSNVMGRD